MIAASAILAALLALCYFGLGTAKVNLLAPMRELAVKVSFPSLANRYIDALEVAAATLLIISLNEPQVGVLSGSGLLLGGSVVVHLRQGDSPRRSAPLPCSQTQIGLFRPPSLA
ncbi:hypothetical protein Franean1_2983 [Parafrankia sp. EAN1pec]|uniref:DoxX family protein n=1 Tax=Parafrankia sp. (strain EAN1pec) TaxID=298653 RepID=UPI00015D9E90|nr:hypothetical protein Franean1_2983 [Frankia sp. EAN1pec]